MLGIVLAGAVQLSVLRPRFTEKGRDETSNRRVAQISVQAELVPDFDFSKAVCRPIRFIRSHAGFGAIYWYTCTNVHKVIIPIHGVVIFDLFFFTFIL